jgi:hypothetical protein
MKNWLRPIENERGFAVIVMISLITVLIISYSLYATNYFLILTSEVERAKRTVAGISLMQQIAQNMIVARQQFVLTGGLCSNSPYTEAAHEACIRPDTGTKADQLCVENPFSSALAPTLLCATNGPNPTDRNIIEFTYRWDVQWYDRYLAPIRKFNFEVGKTLVAAIEGMAPLAVAYPNEEELPTLAGAPEVTKEEPIKTCSAGDNPSEECIRCRQAGGAPEDAIRPECFLLKVCVLDDTTGDGYADCTIDAEWFWQMVAVTNPIGGP